MAPSKHTQKIKLAFNEPIVSGKAAGRQISGIVLYDRLKKLNAELKLIPTPTSEDSPDLSLLLPLSSDLLDKSLLAHKDKPLKALVALCLAHVLRLFAPDAPYTQAQLRDIFLFVFKQLQNIFKSDLTGSQSEVACYSEYAALVENLATVKSVVLVADLPKADALMTDIFRHFIIGVRNDTSKRLQKHMTDILCQLMEEAETLPAEIITLLLAQVEDGAQPHKAEFVMSVIQAQQERLQRSLTSHFSEVLVAGAQREIEEEEMTAIEIAHQQICNLHVKVPLVLLSVVPQLEMELVIENTEIRTLATKTLGKMFSHPQTLARESPAVWKAWLLKELDKSIEVRSEFASCLLQILTVHPELAEEASQKLINKLMDSDEKVRVHVCKIFTAVDYELALHFLPKLVLQQLALRCADKKRAVRALAMQALGRLYNLAFGQIESRDNQAMDQFAWIPTAFFSPLSNPLLDVRVDAEQCVHKYILPLPKNSTQPVLSSWVDRLLVVMASFASQNMDSSILVLSNIKFCRDTFAKYLIACKRYNGGTIDKASGLEEETVKKELEDIIRTLSISTLDSTAASAELHAFADANVKMAYQSLERIMKPDCDMPSFLKNRQEFFNRVSAMKGCSTETFEQFVDRSSFPIINTATSEELVKKLEGATDVGSADDIFASQRGTVLGWIAKYQPIMLQAFSSRLFKIISCTSEGESRTVIDSGSIALACIAALSRTTKLDELSEQDNLDILLNLASTGNDQQTKNACRAIAHSSQSEQACGKLLQTIVSSLQSEDATPLTPKISAVMELAKSAPVSFEQHAESIFRIILKDMLHRSDESGMLSIDWLQDSQLNDLSRAQLRCLSVMTYRCRSIPVDGQDLHKTMSPVASLLTRIIQQEGSFDTKHPYANALRARMRLQAGICLLKLAKQPGFDKTLFEGHQERYEATVFLLQDEMYEVRRDILTRIMKLASMMQSSSAKWQASLSLVSQDPEREAKELVSRFWITRQTAWEPKCRLALLEMPFVRLLHLLSHHPDFRQNSDDIKDMAIYIKFYLDRMLSKQNATFLFHIAQKLKTVRDRDARFSSSENLYMFSELACHLITSAAHRNSWPLTTHQGKISMPADIFAPLSSPERAREIASKRYLDPSWLPAGPGSSVMSPKKKVVQIKKSPKPAKTTAVKRKRRSTGGNGSDGDEDIENGGDSKEKENRSLESNEEMRDVAQRPRRAAAASANLLFKGQE